MIITKIYGGIGNQMFQYAMGRSLALRNRCRLKFDIRVSEFSTTRKFQLDNYAVVYDGKAEPEEIDKITSGDGVIGASRLDFLRPVYKRRVIRDKNTGFNNKILSVKDPALVDGYWQSEKYFNDFRDQISNELKLKAEFLSENYQRAISTLGTGHKVSVHIRRGDYISIGAPLIPMDYYHSAEKIVREIAEDPSFIIFSDDIGWAKSNLKIGNRQVWIDNSFKLTDCENLELMSGCDHHIIANSTFSWWGAWLSRNPDKKIIYPSIAKTHLNKDLMPESWIEI